MAEYGRHPLGSYKYGPSAQNNSGTSPEAPVSLLFDISSTFSAIIDDDLYETVTAGEITATGIATSYGSGTASLGRSVSGTAISSSEALGSPTVESGGASWQLLLDITATPQTFTTGNWFASTLNSSGRWRFSFTPTNASGNAEYSNFHALLNAADDGGIWFDNSRNLGLYNTTGAAVANQAITWGAGDTITVEVDNPNSLFVISGALTGNGSFSFTPSGTYFTAANSLTAGRHTPNTFFDFNGTVGDVEVWAVGSDDITPSGIATAYASGAASLERSIVGTGIASAEAFGTPGIEADGEIAASAIASLEAFGSATLEADTEVVPAGIASAYASGTATIDTGAPVELSVHGLTAQTFGSGSNPCRVTLSVTAGSLLIMGRAGKSSDQSTAPTDGTDTWTQIDTTRDYADWSGYGQSAWFCRNTVTGSKNIDCFVTSFDEHTSSVVEILGDRLYVQSEARTQVANASGSTSHASASVTATGPAMIIAHWWGAGPVGNGNHVVTASNGFVELESFGFDDPNGYVQHYLFYKIVESAGSYSTTFTQSPSQGAQSRLIAIQSATLIPSGIASTESHGSTVIESGADLIGSGVASSEAFGTANADRYVNLSAVTSAEAHGTASTQVSVAPSGTATAQAFGTGLVQLGFAASAIATAEAFGTGHVYRYINGNGIATSEAFGTGAIGSYVDLSGIATSESFGTGSFGTEQLVLPSGIASAEAFGTASTRLDLTMTAIASSEAFGTGATQIAVTLFAIGTGESFGTADVSGAREISPVAIVSAEGFGAAVFQLPGRLIPTGIEARRGETSFQAGRRTKRSVPTIRIRNRRRD